MRASRYFQMRQRSVAYLNTTLAGTDWSWTPKRKLAILEIPKGAKEGVLYFWEHANGKSKVSFDHWKVPAPTFTIDEAEVIAFCCPLQVRRI